MKGFFAALLIAALMFAAISVDRETVMAWLMGGDPDPFPPIEKKNDRRVSFRPTRPLSEAEYLEWGFPGADSRWGLKELDQFRDVLSAHLEEHPSNLPSADSEYGRGVFHQIRSMTERSGSVHWKARIDFYESFDAILMTYDRASAQFGYRYDWELALMCGLVMRVVCETLTELESKYQSADRTLLPNQSEFKKQRLFDNAYSDLKRQSQKACGSYFEILEYPQFFRPESRRLMAAYVNKWFPDVSRILNLNYHGRVRAIRDRETDPETANYYAELSEKMKNG